MEHSLLQEERWKGIEGSAALRAFCGDVFTTHCLWSISSFLSFAPDNLYMPL